LSTRGEADRRRARPAAPAGRPGRPGHPRRGRVASGAGGAAGRARPRVNPPARRAIRRGGSGVPPGGPPARLGPIRA